MDERLKFVARLLDGEKMAMELPLFDRTSAGTFKNLLETQQPLPTWFHFQPMKLRLLNKLLRK